MKILQPKITLESFYAELSNHPTLVLMLDYDGTLAPFTVNREKSFPYEGIEDRLQNLIKIPQVKVIIVSGRSLSDLRKVLHLRPEPEMWGSHGLEWKNEDGDYFSAPLDEQFREGLKEARHLCSKYPEYFEIKPYSIALHWRGLDKNTQENMETFVRKEWSLICEKHPLEIHSFNGGIELRIKGKNKGEVIKEVLKTLSSVAHIAYMGDDLTDEDAFKVLQNRGLKIIMGKSSHKTLADIQFESPEEILLFFDHIASIYQMRKI